MQFSKLHDWDLSCREAIALQKKLADRIRLQDELPSRLETVAGVDVSYQRHGELFFAAVVVVRLADLTMVEGATACRRTTFPYVPGLLSFRELPVVLDAFRRLQQVPGAVLVDGQGIAHPRRLGLASYDMDSIKKHGPLTRVIRQAMGLVADSSDRFGVSIDLDVLDPRDAPGVNTPEQGGIRWHDLQQAIALLRSDSRLVGLEIAEFNPTRDRAGRTQEVIAGLIRSFYGDRGGEGRSAGLSSDSGRDAFGSMLNS